MMDRSAQMHRARKGVKQETEERERRGLGKPARPHGDLLLQRGIGGVPIQPHLWCLPPPHSVQRTATY